jgi:NitT/TauT family transport system ATP-binding protein
VDPARLKAPVGRLEVRHVSKAFGDSGGAALVLDRCSLELEPGTLTVMVGPSGCGKTTLINLIAGYERPTSGEIRLDGRTVNGPGADRLVVFQETALFPWMSVLDNVAFGPLARGTGARAEVLQRARTLLGQVGLRGFADRYPRQLSGGMQRRVELARAIINEPTLMLMDEPFRGLDAMTRELMQEHYLRLFEERPRTNLFVTSELKEAVFLGDRLLVMTQKPTRVLRAIDIDLPRPREFHMLTSARFREIYAAALVALHGDGGPTLVRRS